MMGDVASPASRRPVEVGRGILALALVGILMNPAPIYAFSPGQRVLRMSQVVDAATPKKVSEVGDKYRRRPEAIPADKLIGMPFSRFRREQAKRYRDAQELEQLMGSLAEAVKAVAGFTRVVGVPDYREEFDQMRVYRNMGEGRRHNEIARRLLEVALCSTGKLGVVAYPGKPPTVIDEGFGNFIATINPLVGAGGLDAAVPTGTVIGVFDDSEEDGCIIDYDIDEASRLEELCLLKTLQPGRNLLGAAYAMYSSSCELVLAVKGEGVHGFTLDPQVGEFILTKPHIRIPERGSVYCLDESRRDTWAEPVRAYVDRLRAGEGETGQKYSYRLVGSAVADVHRVLVSGGVWGRPHTDRGEDEYGGDRTGGLAVLGEASPLAFIIEQAGGRAIDGQGNRVLNIRPETLRQKTGVFLGSRGDVEELERACQAQG